jgi:type I restriction enzyme S subunit
MKFLFAERVQKGYPEEPLLAATQSMGVVRKEEYGSRTVTAMKDLHLLKLVEEGDFVISLRSFQGGIEKTHSKGIISPAYTVLKPRKEALSTYYARFFKSPDFISALTLFVTGIREGQNVDYERLSRAYLPLPPPEEQMAIGRFLDWANGRLERAIRAKRKVIALLNEQKQAIIHRAVTRGLDANVPLKSSGMPWLGDIPQHWETMRLKFIATKIVDCLHATPIYSEDGEYPAIRTADVQPGRLLLESARSVDADHYQQWTARLTPLEGDILYTREGERFGIAALVPPNVRLCISQRMMAFRLHPAVNSAYFMWQINCRHVYAQAAADLIGAAAPHVNVERIKNFWLVHPPKEEQDSIVAAINSAFAGMQEVISRAQREISLLREYRARLIGDVVTGKLDVRAAAAQLPDEVEEPEPLDELDSLADADEEPADDLDSTPEKVEI